MKYEVKVKVDEVCGFAVFDENMSDSKIKGQVSCIVGLSRHKRGMMSQPSLPLQERKYQVEDHISFRAMWYRNSDDLRLETKLNNLKQKTFELSVMLSRGSEQILVGVASLKFTSTVFETEVHVPIHLIGSSKAVDIVSASKTRGQKKFLGKEDQRDSFFQSNPSTINNGVRTVCFKGGDSKRRYGLVQGAFIKLKCSCLPKQKVNLIHFQSMITENYWYTGETVIPTLTKSEMSHIDSLKRGSTSSSEETIERYAGPELSSEEPPMELQSVDSKQEVIDAMDLLPDSQRLNSIPGEELSVHEPEISDRRAPQFTSDPPQNNNNVSKKGFVSISAFRDHVGHKIQVELTRIEQFCTTTLDNGCFGSFKNHTQEIHQPQQQAQQQTQNQSQQQQLQDLAARETHSEELPTSKIYIPSMIDIIKARSVDISEIQMSLISTDIQKVACTSSDMQSEMKDQTERQQSYEDIITESKAPILAMKSKANSRSVAIKHNEHYTENFNAQKKEVETPGTTALYISNFENTKFRNEKSSVSIAQSANKAKEGVDDDIEKQQSFGTTALGSLLGVDITEVKKSGSTRVGSRESEKVKLTVNTYEHDTRTTSSKGTDIDSNLDVSDADESLLSRDHLSREEGSAARNKARTAADEASENYPASYRFVKSPQSGMHTALSNSKSKTTSSYTTYTSLASVDTNSEGRTSAILSPTSRANCRPVFR